MSLHVTASSFLGFYIKFGTSIIELFAEIVALRFSAFADAECVCVRKYMENRTPWGSLIIINIAVDNSTGAAYNIAMACIYLRETPLLYTWKEALHRSHCLFARNRDWFERIYIIFTGTIIYPSWEHNMSLLHYYVIRIYKNSFRSDLKSLA